MPKEGSGEFVPSPDDLEAIARGWSEFQQGTDAEAARIRRELFNEKWPELGDMIRALPETDPERAILMDIRQAMFWILTPGFKTDHRFGQIRDLLKAALEKADDRYQRYLASFPD